MIQPSFSEWSSPTLVVPKKNGKLHLCMDYRALNDVTLKDAYPLPRIDEMVDHLHGSRYFTSIDLTSRYWQFEVHPDDQSKTAFATPRGLFEWRVLPFGLTGAPGFFQRAMNHIFSDFIGKFLIVYLDDLNIFSHTFEEHLQHLEMVFKRIEWAKLRMNPEKSFFIKDKIDFLGYVISKEGIMPQQSKVQKIWDTPIPKTKTELRAFLGLANYYLKFVKGYAEEARHLHRIAGKKANYHWEKEQHRAFRWIKEALTNAPILKYPNFSKPFVLHTDASKFALGAVLEQDDDKGKPHPIVYASRTLNNAEQRYSTTEREALAVVWAVGYLKHYLLGKTFKVVTDHQPLKGVFKRTEPQGRLGNLVIKMLPYDFTIEYRRGALHQNADALS